MNTAKIKAYAPVARREFIEAVTAKAHLLGLSDDEILPVDVQGDVAIIGGQAFPKKIAEQRRQLEERIRRDGFALVMRAMAYTWFNRFVAIRYMELHDYFDHGFRVLSSPNGTDTPEILEQAAHVDLPGINKDEVVELRLAGEKDEELYRLLLIAQCNELHKAMPFLFDAIGGATELLLPENLLHSGSAIRNLVNSVPDEDWQEVEIIGWLYQFYISEKKDEVIGKVVKSEDIPAATQLFTPNWIVKYMVQNSLGRKWMMTYPDSSLKEKMEFYIEPAEQEAEVQQQLDEITPKELNPEDITLLDPACGSGHILVEAYDLFKEIYQERGYRLREIPRLILEKNLYGLDIDDRAAQLTIFCLLMKGREDDRRLLSRDDLQINVLAIQESKGIDSAKAATALQINSNDMAELVELFEHGKTFGSLIQVPGSLAEKLDKMIHDVDKGMNELTSLGMANLLRPIMDQVKVLATKYDCVVANPPYMGMRGMNQLLKKYTSKYYSSGKLDLYSSFLLKNLEFSKDSGFVGMITMHSWMFLQRYYALRRNILQSYTLSSLLHLGTRAFREISGEVVQSVAFIIQNTDCIKNIPTFVRLTDTEDKETEATQKSRKFSSIHQKEFLDLPSSVFSYWATKKQLNLLCSNCKIDQEIVAREGMATGSNDTFLREWSEVNIRNIHFACTSVTETIGKLKKWYPYHKGGTYRKWYGNTSLVVNWKNDGESIKNFKDKKTGRVRSHNYNGVYSFKEGMSWSAFSSNAISVRYSSCGFLFDSKGVMGFSDDDIKPIIGLLNSVLGDSFLQLVSPTLDFKIGHILCIPFERSINNSKIITNVENSIRIAQHDWDSFETSWDFQDLPWLISPLKSSSTQQSFQNWQDHCITQIKKMQELETENNRLFIEAYGLEDELKREVLEGQITLARADQEADIKRLISYAMGCMMGRYSLDEPGLIYAHSGNKDFDHARYSSFPADDDGLIPVMDMDWFEDDATNRLIEFLKNTWGDETLNENLQFIVETLKQKKSESPEDAIRRYFSTTFFKDHLKTYKKRPIYWLFTSGKLKAFTCLVYLHRYNESTLPRMRSAYVTPLQGKFNARVEYLQTEIRSAATASAKKKYQKELNIINKKQLELSKFDEELRHYADKRITLDLDDGVKVNYGKFGTLLAEKKAVTGKK